MLLEFCCYILTHIQNHHWNAFEALFSKRIQEKTPCYNLSIRSARVTWRAQNRYCKQQTPHHTTCSACLLLVNLFIVSCQRPSWGARLSDSLQASDDLNPQCCQFNPDAIRHLNCSKNAVIKEMKRPANLEAVHHLFSLTKQENSLQYLNGSKSDPQVMGMCKRKRSPKNTQCPVLDSFFWLSCSLSSCQGLISSLEVFPQFRQQPLRGMLPVFFMPSSLLELLHVDLQTIASKLQAP